MRASDRAYRTLLGEIQRGELAPGTVLNETQQAERLGVSRTPLRDALKRLVADGLVAKPSARVTVVTGIDADQVKQLFVARRALEESVAREAALRCAADTDLATTFQELAGVFREIPLATEADRETYYDTIARLDDTIDAASDNAYLAAALRPLRAHLVRVRRNAQDRPARLAASAIEHADIAEAIAAGDAELAVHATHIHLHHALREVLETLTTHDSSARSTVRATQDKGAA